MPEQHLSLVFVDAVQRGGEHQLAAWEKQPKGDLAGQCGARNVACAQTETHGGGIGGDQPQAMPARNKAVLPGAPDDPIVEQRNGRQGQLGAGLGEGLFGDVVHQLCLLAQMGKELIDLNP